MNYVISILLAYLLGSIPTPLIVSKFLHKDDIRQHGSGNPGVSNMTRTFGLGSGALTLLGDAGKGVLGTLVGLWMCGPSGIYYSAIAAVFGHNWSIFLGFKGGKGVATSFGIVLVLNPVLAVICLAVFVVTVLISRYFSLGSIIALLTYWVVTLCTSISNVPLVLTITFLVWLSIFKHRSNIKRLLNGTENKL